MKVSLNWVRQFTDVDVSVDELVTKIGAQLGAIEEIVELGKKYQGVIIAKVVECEKHTNADKLNVCKIDDGGKAEGVERDERGLVQVVCGAPNVRAGLTVAWLPPGATVPSTFDKDPFVLGARELRGVVSNGMLASGQELAISDDHNGIVELEGAAKAGDDFAAVYGLNDFIIDIENKMFTHRPDCFGLIGVAREIAGIQHKPFISPDWYKRPLDRIKPGKTKLELKVSNTLPNIVPRFTAVAMADVKIGPSPFMLQALLSRVGLRPINNIVDITNYIMYLTGQPTHAYDADKLAKYGELSLETRMSRQGDKINLLNGKSVELQDDSSILITSNDVPVGMAGCMGGADTEVDETTKNIILECANFDMYSIRRTSMKYGLFTDAVTRFNKGQSALQNEVVLEELVAMVQSLGGAQVASPVFDQKSEAVAEKPAVHTTVGFITERLGVQLSAENISSLLQNVEFIVAHSGDDLTIVAPYWRTDIDIPEDIVEEVGRLYGYDQLPLLLPQRGMSPGTVSELLATKRVLRGRLATSGANEVLTYGFVHGDLMKKVGQDFTHAFKIGNAISPDLQYYRLSLTPSLLEKVHGNIKAGYDEFALFELGKTHSKTEIDDNNLPREFERLSLVLARRNLKEGSSAYYQAKYYLEQLMHSESERIRYVTLQDADTSNHVMFQQMLAPYEPKRSAVVYAGDKLVGVVGEYKSSVAKQLKLPVYCAGFELFLTPLIEIFDEGDVYVPLSKYPLAEQDITLRVSNNVVFQSVEQIVKNTLYALPDMQVTVSPLSIYQKSDDDHGKQVTFRISLSSYVKTLTTEECNRILDQVSMVAQETVGAVRI